jgi:hypothetical protein
MDLTPQQVEAYHRDGYVFPLRVLESQDAAYYRRCLETH